LKGSSWACRHRHGNQVLFCLGIPVRLRDDTWSWDLRIHHLGTSWRAQWHLALPAVSSQRRCFLPIRRHCRWHWCCRTPLTLVLAACLSWDDLAWRVLIAGIADGMHAGPRWDRATDLAELPPPCLGACTRRDNILRLLMHAWCCLHSHSLPPAPSSCGKTAPYDENEAEV